MGFLQLGMVVNLALIAYQDIRQREVLWFLFPLAALFMGVTYFLHTTTLSFLINSLMNLSVVTGVLGILFVYAKFKMKKSLFKEVFGLGDALFFIAFALGFPFVTFTVLFVFSLLFSLVLTLLIQRNKQMATIPLAGYMAIFLIMVFSFSWVSNGLNLYLL